MSPKPAAPSSRERFLNYAASWLWFTYGKDGKGRELPATGLLVLFAPAGLEDAAAAAPSPATRRLMQLGFVDVDGVLRSAVHGLTNPWYLASPRHGAQTNKDGASYTENHFLFSPAVPFTATTYFVCYIGHPSPVFASTLLKRLQSGEPPVEGSSSDWPFQRLEVAASAQRAARTITVPSDAGAYVPRGAERYHGWVLYRRMPYGHLPEVKESVRRLAYDLGRLRYPAGCYAGMPNPPYPASESSHSGEFDLALAASLHRFHQDREAKRFYVVRDGCGPAAAATNDWSYLFGEAGSNLPYEDWEERELTRRGEANRSEQPAPDTRARDEREAARRERALLQLGGRYRAAREAALKKERPPLTTQTQRTTVVDPEVHAVLQTARWLLQGIALGDAAAWDAQVPQVDAEVMARVPAIAERSGALLETVPATARRQQVILREYSSEQAYRRARHMELVEAGTGDFAERDRTVTSELEPRRAWLEARMQSPAGDPSATWPARHEAALSEREQLDSQERAARAEAKQRAADDAARAQRERDEAAAAEHPDAPLPEPADPDAPADDGSRTPGVADAATEADLARWASERKCKLPPYLVPSGTLQAQPMMWWRFWALQEVCSALGAMYLPSPGSTLRALGAAGGSGQIPLSYHKLGRALDVDAFYPVVSPSAPFVLEARYPKDTRSSTPSWLINAHSRLPVATGPSPDKWNEAERNLAERVMKLLGVTAEAELPPTAQSFLGWFHDRIADYRKRSDWSRYLTASVRQFVVQPGTPHGGTVSPPLPPTRVDAQGPAQSWLNVSQVAHDLGIGVISAHSDFADVTQGARQRWKLSPSKNEEFLAYQLDNLANAISLADAQAAPVSLLRGDPGEPEPVPTSEFDLVTLRHWVYRRGDPTSLFDGHPYLPLQTGMAYHGVDLVFEVLFEEDKKARDAHWEFLLGRGPLRVRVLELGDGVDTSNQLHVGRLLNCKTVQEALAAAKPVPGQANRRVVLRPLFFRSAPDLLQEDPSLLEWDVPQTPDWRKLEWWHMELVPAGLRWSDLTELLGWAPEVLFAPRDPDPVTETPVWTGGAGLVERARLTAGPDAPPRRDNTRPDLAATELP